MILPIVAIVVLGLVSPAPTIGLMQPGAYRSQDGHVIYIGPERTLPDKRFDQYYDDVTRRIGDARSLGPLRQIATVQERRFLVNVDGARLGASVWHASEDRRPAMVLIHGNDDETREMGFLIPYFVLHGMSVITYDQRGTGESAGSWRAEGPPDRARDVAVLVAAVKRDAHVDPHAIGLWAFSNGGWTAPIVAARVPIAFMILKSAPAETQQDNILYEVDQRMREHHYRAAEIQAALQVVRTVIDALSGHASWSQARAKYVYAKKQRWFADSALPEDFPMPPPPALAAAFRRAAIYDPAPTLRRVRTPTIAFFGALDRNVNFGYSAPAFRRYFKSAGVHDFTERIFAKAGHSLEVSETGYYDQPALPRRLVPYLPATIDWLRARRFAK